MFFQLSQKTDNDEPAREVRVVNNIGQEHRYSHTIINQIERCRQKSQEIL